ncbi:ULK kinase [Toxoplasma gondii]|uniref:ULK kinase n=1 Tax=Toxoplasma gondii TaxID=5811 RepID=A0A7J6KIC9_TOXGO|nr:ULK kinase [Toxoplasma gondii]
MIKSEVNILKDLDTFLGSGEEQSMASLGCSVCGSLRKGCGNHPNVVKYVDFFEDRHFFYAVLELCDVKGAAASRTHCREPGEKTWSKQDTRDRRDGEKEIGEERREEIEEEEKCVGRTGSNERQNSRLLVRILASADSTVLPVSQGVKRSVERVTGDFYVSWVTRSAGRTIAVFPFRLKISLFKSKSPDSLIKLIDFGMSAKQTLRNGSDMWAFGVMIYLMLFGRYPFEGAKPGHIAREVQHKQLDWTSKECMHLTESCVDFLSRLLDRNYRTRLTAAQALQHPWISTCTPLKELSIINPENLELARRLSVDSEHTGGHRVAARVNSKMAIAEKEFRKGKSTGRRISVTTANSRSTLSNFSSATLSFKCLLAASAFSREVKNDISSVCGGDEFVADLCGTSL